MCLIVLLFKKVVSERKRRKHSFSCLVLNIPVHLIIFLLMFPENCFCPKTCCRLSWDKPELLTPESPCRHSCCIIFAQHACALCFAICSSVVTCAPFPPQCTPECWRNPRKNSTASSVTPSSAKKSEDVSECRTYREEWMHFLKSCLWVFCPCS